VSPISAAESAGGVVSPDSVGFTGERDCTMSVVAQRALAAHRAHQVLLTLGPHHGPHGAALAAQVLDVGVDDGVVRAGHDDDVGAPACTHSSMTSSTAGVPPIGSISLGTCEENGRNRVPCPAAVTTARSLSVVTSANGLWTPKLISTQFVVATMVVMWRWERSISSSVLARWAMSQGVSQNPSRGGEAALLEDSAGLTRRDAAVGQARRADR
jgi:hypothetical protein